MFRLQEMFLIARRFAKEDDAYGIHRTGVNVC